MILLLCNFETKGGLGPWVVKLAQAREIVFLLHPAKHPLQIFTARQILMVFFWRVGYGKRDHNAEPAQQFVLAATPR